MADLRVAPGLADHVASHTGHVELLLRGDPDRARGERAMAAARDALFAIPHPEEPDDPLPSIGSDITTTADGVIFWFDIADAEAYDGLIDEVVRAMVSALVRNGAEGLLTWPDGPTEGTSADDLTALTPTSVGPEVRATEKAGLLANASLDVADGQAIIRCELTTSLVDLGLSDDARCVLSMTIVDSAYASRTVLMHMTGMGLAVVIAGGDVVHLEPPNLDGRLAEVRAPLQVLRWDGGAAEWAGYLHFTRNVRNPVDVRKDPIDWQTFDPGAAG